jgi:hypothetical protein
MDETAISVLAHSIVHCIVDEMKKSINAADKRQVDDDNALCTTAVDNKGQHQHLVNPQYPRPLLAAPGPA